jgi:tetratricopeptide (TPR) repeat protein
LRQNRSPIQATWLNVLVLIGLMLAFLACDDAALQHLKQGPAKPPIVKNDNTTVADPGLSSSDIARLDKKTRLLLAADYQAQAMAAMSKGESGTARNAFTKAIECDPDLAEAYCYRAINDMDSGAPYWGGATWDRILADCNRAIELKPGYAKAYDARGFFNCKVGETDQGIADYSRAIELDPNDAVTCYHRGLAYYNQKQLDLALIDLSRSIQLNPSGLHDYYYRGMIYSKQGKWDAAIADLSKVAERASIAWPEPGQELARVYYQRSLDYITRGQADLAIEIGRASCRERV